MPIVVIIKWKPKNISNSSFACRELSRVNSFISFLWGSIGEDHYEIVEVDLICIIVDLTKSPYCLVFSCLLNACRFQLSPMHVHYYYYHTVRSCEWKAIMTIYDGLIEMRKAGMNSTYLVFVNMISSSFLIQPIMNGACLQWQLEIIVTYAMLN